VTTSLATMHMST